MRRSMAYKVCGRQTLVRARADGYVRCNRGPASGGLVALIARCCGTQLSLLEGAPSYGGRGGGAPAAPNGVVRRTSFRGGCARAPSARSRHAARRAASRKQARAAGRQDGRAPGTGTTMCGDGRARRAARRMRCSHRGQRPARREAVERWAASRSAGWAEE